MISGVQRASVLLALLLYYCLCDGGVLVLVAATIKLMSDRACMYEYDK